jgi:quercetin dioxygenase-like cupin family protein
MGGLTMNRTTALSAVVVACIGLAACSDTSTPAAAPKSPRLVPGDAPLRSAGSGFTQTADVRANVGDFHVQSHFDGFDVELKSHDNADIEVSNQTGAPNGSTGGWHSHPGPVLVLVKSGVGTLYDADGLGCTVRTFAAGSTFIEGTNPHTLRNEGTVPLEITAVYFVPAGKPRRIEAAVPANCPP